MVEITGCRSRIKDVLWKIMNADVLVIVAEGTGELQGMEGRVLRSIDSGSSRKR